MALIIDLKPDEKLLVGSTLITNDKQRTRLMIDGDSPVLREKDILHKDDAQTPSKKFYYTIQCMYLASADTAYDHLDDYFVQLKALRNLAPHIHGLLQEISAHIFQGFYYKALKSVRDLIAIEAGEHQAPNPKDRAQSSQSTMMEAQFLKQSADQLQDLYNTWDGKPANEVENTVQYNRKLWAVFFDDVDQGQADRAQKPAKTDDDFDIKRNIVNLYQFVYRRSNEIIDGKDKEKLLTLIDLNRETVNCFYSYSPLK